MALSSQDMGSGRPAPNRTPAPPPLRRDALDPLKRPSLIALGVLFLAISGLSTVMRTDDLLAVFGVRLDPMSTLGLGVLIVVGITWAEVQTSESLWYVVPLTIDVGFTVWWTWYGFHTAAANIGAPTWSAVLLGVALGLLSAWAPERILFGARRKVR